MRLPAITVQQRQHEDSRQRHEELYQAFLDGTRVQRPITPDTWIEDQNATSANARAFWRTRGFRIRTKTNAEKTVMDVWLEATDPQPVRIRREHVGADETWAQPAGRGR